MGDLLQDLRIGLRALWKDRAFSSTVAVTLAVCLAANVALFSVVRHVLLRPLPLPEPERLVYIGNSYPRAGVGNLRAVGVPDFYDRLRETTAFEDQALYNNSSVNIDLGNTPTRVRVMNVTPSFFRVLRVAPLQGRAFTDEEGEVGKNQALVLSYGLWQSAFGGDPGIVGRETRIDGLTYAVVGVMPRDFVFDRPDVMLWRPLAFTPQQKSDQARHSNNFQQIARLKPGATVERGQAEIDALNAANLDRFPQFKEVVVNAGFHTIVTGLQDDVVRDVKRSLYLLWGGALFVLLIGCVNVANLVLARSRSRLRELATRVALGAARTRIARQLVTESLVLTLGSAVAGLALGWGSLRLLAALNMLELPRSSEIRLDWTAVVIALAAGAAIGVVLGLVPVAGVRATRLTAFLREEGRGGTNYAIRTAGDPAAIGGAVGTTIRSLDRELAVFDTLTMAERVDRSLRIRRSPMLLAISFGVIGLFLSAVGIYGVLVYVVAQRTRELGVRMALGCGRRQIFDLVLREGLTLVAAGFVIGVLGALALRQSLQSQLYGIAAGEPFVLALVTATLAVVAVAASTLPAHRATRIDPIVALTE